MILFWKIRCFDRTAKEFKDRSLYLDTTTLEPAIRAAIELVAEDQASRRQRDILKYRHLFHEGDWQSGTDGVHAVKEFKTVGPQEYFEDDNRAEISLQEVGQLLTGDPNALLIPQGARQHDIDLMLSEPKPIPVAEVSLDQDDIRLLGYFIRDLRELQESAFMKDGPGTLQLVGSIAITVATEPVLKTAVTDDEIRSFVTIFRRLYMENEPANLKKAVAVFVKSVGDHPYAKWVAGGLSEFERHLAAVPDLRPHIQPGVCTFTSKRLLDVFLYTQYAHQPDERRQRQFGDCLSQVYGKRNALTWMFLMEMWKRSLEIGNAGRVIAGWFNRYCEHHNTSPDVVQSLRHDHAGLGAEEKDEERKVRLFGEKTEQLAIEIWKQKGSPEGGHFQFIATAHEQLRQALDMKEQVD